MDIPALKGETPESLKMKIEVFLKEKCIEGKRHDEYSCKLCGSDILKRNAVITRNSDGMKGTIKLNSHISVPYCPRCEDVS